MHGEVLAFWRSPAANVAFVISALRLKMLVNIVAAATARDSLFCAVFIGLVTQGRFQKRRFSVRVVTSLGTQRAHRVSLRQCHFIAADLFARVHIRTAHFLHVFLEIGSSEGVDKRVDAAVSVSQTQKYRVKPPVPSLVEVENLPPPRQGGIQRHQLQGHPTHEKRGDYDPGQYRHALFLHPLADQLFTYCAHDAQIAHAYDNHRYHESKRGLHKLGQAH